jgi:phage-related protein
MAFDTWAPLAVPQLGTTFADNENMLEAKFGDGYRQTVADGLNAIWQGGELMWNGVNQLQFDDIRTFWRAHALSGRFYWTLPDEETSRLWQFTGPLKRTQFRKNADGDRFYSLSTTIEERFDLA